MQGLALSFIIDQGGDGLILGQGEDLVLNRGGWIDCRPDSMPLRVDTGPSPLPARKVLPSPAASSSQAKQPSGGQAPPGPPPDPSPLLRRKVLSSSVSSSGSGSLSRLSVM